MYFFHLELMKELCVLHTHKPLSLPKARCLPCETVKCTGRCRNDIHSAGTRQALWLENGEPLRGCAEVTLEREQQAMGRCQKEGFLEGVALSHVTPYTSRRQYKISAFSSHSY